MQALRFDNLITKEKSKMFLLGLGIWGPNDDVSLKKLEKYLDDKKVALYRALYDADRKKSIRKMIKGAKKSVNNAYGRKHSLDYMTLDYHAFLTKRKFLVGMCLRDPQDKPVYDEHDFEHSSSTVLERVIEYLDTNLINIEEYRELARNDPWRSIWNVEMYDNAYQSMECPSDEVFEDDDIFDGWMINQRRTREKEQKQKELDTTKNIPDKAQEVFVFAPTREDADQVYDLNDATGRMKIKQRTEMIERLGSVEAKDLPDTQMELRNQQMEEYKNKMHRGG